MVHTQLLQPTGNYKIGTLAYHLKDAGRKEPHAAVDNEHRELMIQIWYPAQDTGTTMPAAYPAEEIKQAYHLMESIPLEKLDHIDDLVTHSYDAPPLYKNSIYPVVIFSPGFGTPRAAYLSLFEELASHGYLVVGLNHTHFTRATYFPDGTMVPQHPKYSPKDATLDQYKELLDEAKDVWVDDLESAYSFLKTINRNDPHTLLTGAFDFSRVAVGGHSFGGCAATHFVSQHPEVRALYNFDGTLFGNLPNEKIMCRGLFVHPFYKPNDEVAWYLLTPDEAHKLAACVEKCAYIVTYKDADHDSFSDANFLLKRNPGLDPQSACSMTRNLMLTYLNKYLKKENIKMKDVEQLHAGIKVEKL